MKLFLVYTLVMLSVFGSFIVALLIHLYHLSKESRQ